MPTFNRGSTIYLKTEVVDKHATTLEDAALNGTVQFSLNDGQTWDAGEWVGAAYLKREGRETHPARIARRTATLAITDATASPLVVDVKVTDSPEVYVIKGLRATITG